MISTTEHATEIISIVNRAQRLNNQIGNYQEHFRTIDGKNGYYVFLDNNSRIFIHKNLVDDFPNIAPESIERIVESFEKL